MIQMQLYTENYRVKLCLITLSYSFVLFFWNKNINKQPKTKHTQNYFHIYATSKHFLKQKNSI